MLVILRTVFFSFFIFGLVFILLLVSPKGNNQQFHNQITYQSGQVLGVSESAQAVSIENLIADYYNPLPESEDSYFIPIEKVNSTSISLPTGSGIVIEPVSESILFSQQADKVVPIASITKLITALVFLDINPGWETEYTIKPTDFINGGRIYIKSGERVTVRDLFHISLIGSANVATRALVS